MNPLATVTSSSPYEAVQRIDTARSGNPAAGSDTSRAQQVERAQQPTSSVGVSISETARSRASEDLAATQTVSGSTASSATPQEIRRQPASEPTPGQLVDERA